MPNTNPNEVGAVWLKKAKSGTEYLSGHITHNSVKTEIVMFENQNYVEGGKFPKYRILLSTPKEERQPKDESQETPF